MALFTFWNSDTPRAQATIDGAEVRKVFDIEFLASLTKVHNSLLEKRFEAGNEAWVLFVNDEPVSFGWIGRGRIHIGELARELTLPSGDAYFWNFRTLENHRRKGYYPYLLQSMISAEMRISNRLWIIAAPENRASLKGIVRSGFIPVGVLGYYHDNSVRLLPFKISDRGNVASKVLDVPLSDAPVKPCWSCYSKTMKVTMSGCKCNETHSCSCSTAVI